MTFFLFVSFHLFSQIILLPPGWAELEARLNASDLEGQSKRVEQLQRESRGNITNKSIINGQQSRISSKASAHLILPHDLSLA